MYSQAIIEEGLIAAIKTLEQLQQAQATGVEAHQFVAHGPIWAFLVDYATKYQSIPTNEQICQQFDKNWFPPTGPLDFWLDEFSRSSLVRQTTLAVHAAMSQLETNPEQALLYLSQQLQQLQTTKAPAIVATDQGIWGRVAKYEKRVQLHQISQGTHLFGIPTGIEAIDNTHQGWLPGELVGFFARPTVGKTWVLTWLGVTAWRAGYKVLFLSPEMPENQIALRIDALLAAQQGIAFSKHQVFAGDPSYRQAYQQLAQQVGSSARWWTLDSYNGRQISLSDIQALYCQLKPDMILVDGVSLLRDEGSGQVWEQMKRLCYGLKHLATVTETVIVTSHQATNTRRGQRGGETIAQGRGDDWVMPSLNDSAFGDAFVQAASTIFTMAADRDSANIRWYSIRKSRERDIVWKPRMALGWDVDKGKIVDLGRYGDNLMAIETHLRQVGILK